MVLIEANPPVVFIPTTKNKTHRTPSKVAGGKGTAATAPTDTTPLSAAYMTRAADLFRRKAASVVKEKANAEAASAVPAASGAEVSDVGAAAVGRAMTAGRKQAIAAKEAAGAARLAALAAQKAAREEHERAINPNIAKTPIRREVPLRKPKVVVRIRPLASSGGHSNEGEPVSKRLASYGNGKIVLEDEMGVDYGGARAAHARTTEYTFAQAILGPESRQAEVHEAAAAELVQAVCADGLNGGEGYNALLFAYGQTGTGKTHTIFGPEPSWTSLRHEQSGILPRAVASILDTMRARAGRISSVLSCSALEFYMSRSEGL
jgi:hypothetical protein